MPRHDTSAAQPQRGLGDFLDLDVLPRLFERLDEAFPEFGWERTRDGWVATNRETTKRILDARPERVVCNRPCGFYVHGGAARPWVAHVCGGRAPRGEAFVEAVRRLSELAGVPFPERDVSPAELRAIQEAQARREALEAVLAITQRAFAGPEAAGARAYMQGRGLGEAEARGLGLGFYGTPAEVRRQLAPELHEVAREAGLLREQLAGYVVFPWLDDWGRPLTLYFRWQAKTPPDQRPKTVALPGAGTKASPLYFDRARAAGERDLVLVEGVLDGALLQARGETRVVACVGAQLSRAQVATLARHRVASVTLCLDPDGAGEKGTLASARALDEVGIAAYVAPQLPDGLDPDELVLRDGVEGFRAHVARAVSAARWRAERVLAGVSPDSPDPVRDRAVRELGEVVAGLRGPTAARERDELLRLLAKATGYRLGTLKEEVPATGAAAAGAASAGPSADRGRGPEARATVRPYREGPAGLVWIKERVGQDGRPEHEEVLLANFTARVTAEITEDDGAEERRLFEVSGRVGAAARTFTIPSSQFEGMDWALEHLGAGAILEPGVGVRDRARHAIQTLSGTPPERRVYTHLGWRRVGERWVYLHAAGAIGAEGPLEGVLVRLEEPLDRFALPEPPEGEALADSVWGCLRVLEVAPKRISVPLFAAAWRAVLGEADLSLFLYGGSGYHKTCLAALVQQCFGPQLHHRNLPGSWESSANALEAELFFAKDALFVVDDFVPTGSAHDRARRFRDADRLLRGQGNRAGRQRMRPDASLRPVRRSRALVLSTGEELPRGESLTARMLVVPVGPGDVDRERLTRCQAEADAGLYARALAGFLSWLAPRYDEVQAALRPGVAALRREVFGAVGGHGRLAEIGGNLFFGLRVFFRFAVDLKLYTAAAAEALLDVCRRALLEALGHQVDTQQDADPLRRFFELLASALASGRAHLAAPSGRVPSEAPLAFGWRLAAEGQPEREPWKPGRPEEPAWQAQGDRVGWVEGDELWLEPEASHLLAQRVSGEEGFALSPRTLRRRLREAGLLKTQPGGRDTCCSRVVLGGVRRSVLHLDTQVLLGGDSDERGSEELFSGSAT